MPGEVTPELLEPMTSMLTSALKASIACVAAATSPTDADNARLTTRPVQTKPPPFSCKEYRPSEGITVEEYFKRFDWSLQLSKISDEQHANYARVYMGAELNNALKFLVNPRESEALTYAEIRTSLIAHFDSAKNKYAESVKFRQIKQQKGEGIAGFALRLRQGAAHCDYGKFLDRMLIEQLLHGLDDRDMCDEIIGKKADTFTAAFEIAHTLEATRHTADTVKTNSQSAVPEAAHALMSTPVHLKQSKNLFRRRSLSRGRGRPQSSRSASRAAPRGSEREDRNKSYTCNGCGASHMRSQCPYRDAECHKCRRKGHIAKVCRSNRKSQTIDHNEKKEQPAEQVDNVMHLNKLEEINTIKTNSKKMLSVQIDG